MNENKLWEKFCENGRVSDYLEYRSCINSIEAHNDANKTELKSVDENNRTGSRNKRTEYR